MRSMTYIKLILIAIFAKYCYCSEISTAEPMPAEPTLLPTPSKPWAVLKNATYACILAKFGAEFVVNDIRIADNEFPLNSSAKVGNKSVCGDEIQIIELLFDGKSFALTFVMNNDSIFVNEINFSYPLTDGSVEEVVSHEIEFKTPKKFGYKCFSEQTIHLNNIVILHIMNTKLEAFRSVNFTEDVDDESEQWERVGLKCNNDRIKTDAWKITGISLGVGIFILGFITLVAIWSGRRQESLMMKIQLTRQWTVDSSRVHFANNNISKNTSTQSLSNSDNNQLNNNNNSFKYQRY